MIAAPNIVSPPVSGGPSGCGRRRGPVGPGAGECRTNHKTKTDMFTPQDLKQIADHGLTPERVEEQVENFRRGFPFLKVVRAASPGDGVLVLDGVEVDAAVARYDAAVAGLRVVKFVPASGAATRMFKELFEFVNVGQARERAYDVLLENIEQLRLLALNSGPGAAVPRPTTPHGRCHREPEDSTTATSPRGW